MKITPREKKRLAAGREKNDKNHFQPRPQGFSLKKWVGVVQGKSPGDEVEIIFFSPRSVSPFLAWGDFCARSRFARSTIPENKWGTIRSLAKTRLTLVFKLHLNLLIHSTKTAVFQ